MLQSRRTESKKLALLSFVPHESISSTFAAPRINILKPRALGLHTAHIELLERHSFSLERRQSKYRKSSAGRVSTPNKSARRPSQ